MHVETNIIQKFLNEGTYTSQKKTVVIGEQELETTDFENFAIGEFYLKRTYLYDEKGNQTVTDETNYTDMSEVFAKNKTFCETLLNDFLTENLTFDISPQDAFALLAKFETTIKFCQLGAVEASYYSLSQITPDDVAFNQVRKDKYLGRFEAYLQ